MKKHAVIVLCASLVFLRVFATPDRAAARVKKAAAAEAKLPQIDKEKIRAHVKYLSSDELEGRGTGQRGGDVAADYIGKQFASYGLKPAGDNGSFFQEVPMVGVKTLPETTFKFAEASGKSFEAKNLTEFVTNNESRRRRRTSMRRSFLWATESRRRSTTGTITRTSTSTGRWRCSS
jgi:hypothetical protein